MISRLGLIWPLDGSAIQCAPDPSVSAAQLGGLGDIKETANHPHAVAAPEHSVNCHSRMHGVHAAIHTTINNVNVDSSKYKRFLNFGEHIRGPKLTNPR